MSDSRDPAIKLFGRTIPVPAPEETIGNGVRLQDHESSQQTDCNRSMQEEEEEEEKDMSNKRTQNKEKDEATQTSEDSIVQDTSSGINENPPPKTPSIDKEITNTKSTKAEEEQSETTTMKEKTLKKPDKILPCPRCNSLDTKFCYYNNYNVNQPRHFCKNCQRYWTAGGTMRNVPVGAGRRKNKNSASHFRQISVPEALQTLRTDMSESICNPPLKPNGTVLSFGLDAPLCESMTSVLNLAEKTMHNCHRNGFHRTEEARFPASCGGENGEDHSSGSSVTASKSREGNWSNLQEPEKWNCQGFPPQIPYFPGPPWNYPWNSAQWGPPLLPPPPPTLLPPPLLPPSPAFCASSFPISFYPAAPYWGCTMPGTWSMPWPSPLSSSSSPSPNPASTGSGFNSPILGKHSREENMCDSENGNTAEQSNSERSLWIPKTLRIDDPDEAAKSSIWATLGIKNDKADMIKGGGLFKGFQSKTADNNHTIDTSQILHANPAALSRSLNFHESS